VAAIRAARQWRRRFSNRSSKRRARLAVLDIDSAAYDGPTYAGANPHAREAIKKMCGKDLLDSHKAKKLTNDLAKQADLILVMTARMKTGLPSGKTWTLKEYAGVPGDVDDPFGGDLGSYISCAHGIADIIGGVTARLPEQRH
jgi:ribose 5-phosphate isomerase B